MVASPQDSGGNSMQRHQHRTTGLLLGLATILLLPTWAGADTASKSVIVISSVGRVSIAAVSKEGVSYVSRSGKAVLKPWGVLGEVRCDDLSVGRSAEGAFTAGDYAKANSLYPKALKELDAHLRALSAKYSAISAAGKSDEALQFFKTKISAPKADYAAYRKVIEHRIERVKAFLAKGIKKRVGKHDGQVQCESCRGKGTVTCGVCSGKGRISCPDCRRHFTNTNAGKWKKQYGCTRPNTPTYYVICPNCRGAGRKIVGYDKRKRPIYRNCDRCKGKIVAVGLTWKRATVVWACSTCSRSSTPGFVVCRQCDKGKAKCGDCGGEGWTQPGGKRLPSKSKPSTGRTPKKDPPSFFGEKSPQNNKPGRKRRKDKSRKDKPKDPWGEDDDKDSKPTPKPKPKPDDDDGVGGF